MADPRTLLRSADKAAASATSGWSFLGGRTEKLENAADLYMQAANAFRVERLGREAGQAFEKAASIQRDINEPDDAANTMVEAFKSYKKTDPEDAARCLQSAIKHYASRGGFRRAATHQQYLAELYEVDLNDIKRAIEAYELAGDWFQGDNADTLANKVYLKAADLAAMEKLYVKAAARYEQVALASANKDLLKWNLKEYFLKAGLCHLAQNDLVAAERAIGNYTATYQNSVGKRFEEEYEYALLMGIKEALKNGDSDAFTDAAHNYDQVIRLDKWKTTILLRIKDNITAAEDDLA